MNFTTRTNCALAVGIVMLTTNLTAQSVWLQPSERSSFSIEVYRLDIAATSRSPNGTVTFANVRMRQKSGLTYVLEFPLAHADESQSLIGNPYFGISFRDNDISSVTFDAGIRLPLASGDNYLARAVGRDTDFARWEAFAPDQTSLRALVGGYWSTEDSPHNGWVKVGFTLADPHNGQNIELLVIFWAGLWYKGDVSIFGANLVGQTLITESDLNLTQRSEVLFGFGYTLKLGNFRPGLHARVPVIPKGRFGLGDRINSSFGFSMTMFFGEKENEK